MIEAGAGGTLKVQVTVIGVNLIFFQEDTVRALQSGVVTSMELQELGVG